MQKRGGWRRKKGIPSRMLFSRLASLRSADKSPFSLFHFLVTRPWADLDIGVSYTHGLYCALHRRVVLCSCFIKESHFFWTEVDGWGSMGQREPPQFDLLWLFKTFECRHPSNEGHHVSKLWQRMSRNFQGVLPGSFFFLLCNLSVHLWWFRLTLAVPLLFLPFVSLIKSRLDF